jgi:hypothetical protein
MRPVGYSLTASVSGGVFCSTASLLKRREILGGARWPRLLLLNGGFVYNPNVIGGPTAGRRVAKREVGRDKVARRARTPLKWL